MRGDLKTAVLSALATGPRNTTTIAESIGRTMKQTNAFMCWMARRGYAKRHTPGRAGRIGSVPSVWGTVNAGREFPAERR